MTKIKLFTTSLFVLLSIGIYAQNNQQELLFSESKFLGLKFRSIGPAFMSGRIADIAIHPCNDNIWYVAVGSGGVWKTVNSGVTWNPIFDKQSSYSIGCVTIDPVNPNTVWVGTGENVGGRHVGYGDGIYKSEDGGKTWKNMGLKTSEHISKIIVHPKNSSRIWVAAQGSLWKKGGERGLYKSTDGGKTWNKTLGDEEWTGATDIQIDPRNPDVLYAASWQRHRNVAAYMGGGPGSGIHKSTDGGNTWKKLSGGLPKTDMGKIGLAISPQKPDIIYAIIELYRTKGGVFRTSNGGMTWKKMSDEISGGTGPHYYQELYASPHEFERLYMVNNSTKISEDGGKTFYRMNSRHKHGDDHAVAFKKNDPDYVMIGSDGGLYESFDNHKNWRYIHNLPVTQFYKVAVDDTEPFYNIYGGTQDNGTQGGPSRTDNVNGIQNSDWKLVLNWDGHQPATEPGNPNIMYAERQQGALSRIDLTTGEVMDIQPHNGIYEDNERFNWDAPILVSPHSPKRLYFASQRVWRSDNRGDEWTAISGELTKKQDRISLPIMGREHSWDAAWDYNAMSNYNTITSLAESPKQEGLIYAGTDDGLIQVTEDGGSNWTKIEVSKLPGVPKTAFVNDIKADLHKAGTVYIALDNHKFGDFNPYLYKSTNKGKTWTSIKANLPAGTLVWRIVQDHVKPGLMFCATEFGIYFTLNCGQKWTKLKGGIPTISFRDLAIQRRENDLIGASFGRGFYVLDNYSILRDVSEKELSSEAKLFSVRKAWWYIQKPNINFEGGKGTWGASHYNAPNPHHGATFTYYLKDDLKSKKKIRQDKEKILKKQNKNIPFQGWEAMNNEKNEEKPAIYIIVKDSKGTVVSRVNGPVTSGFHRITWDMLYPIPNVIRFKKRFYDWGAPKGILAAPGKYTATLMKYVEGEYTKLSEPVSFELVPLHKGVLPGASMEEVNSFWREYEKATREMSGIELSLQNFFKQTKAMKKAIVRSNADVGEFDNQLFQIRKSLLKINTELYGNSAKNEIGEKTKTTISSRLFRIQLGISHSTYGPTPTHKKQLEIVKTQLSSISNKYSTVKTNIKKLLDEMNKTGAPMIEWQ